MEPDNPLLDDHVLELGRAGGGRERPRVCFVPTASGDSAEYIAGFYAAFARRSEASHLALFARTVVDIEAMLLDQDVVYVGGGNTVNMLAVWRVHGVDRALRRAWESGVVMAGVSAGAICWFEGGTTDSFGPDLAGLSDGLGFLPGSFSPHYDGEPGRRPLFRRLVGGGGPARRLRGRRWRRAGLPGHRACRGRCLEAGRPRLPGRPRAGRRRGRDGAPDPLPRLEAGTADSAWRPIAQERPAARPRSPPRGRRSAARRLPTRRRRVSTVSSQPGGTSPGARSASGASTNSRSPAARMRDLQQPDRPGGVVVRGERAGLGRPLDRQVTPEHEQVEVEHARPPARPGGATGGAFQPLEPG